MSSDEDVYVGSGNVFADLGLPDPDIQQAKAALSIRIDQLIEAEGLTQAQAAERMGLTQPAVPRIARGRLSGFSLERLFRCLNALGQDVQITVLPRKKSAGEVRAGWDE